LLRKYLGDEWSKFYKTQDDFQERIRLDKIKEDYCKNNNIDLLIISYKEIKQLENILSDKINLKNGVIEKCQRFKIRNS
jgi:hypothetical protein